MNPAANPVSLDHTGTIVRDLAAGAARWERLGFTLSPVSRQRGRMPGRDEEGAWATANRCAIFQQGYLELIGIVDPAAFNPWTRFIERFEGTHLLAVRVGSADAAWPELSTRPIALNAPVQRERKLDVDGTQRTMRFRNIFSRDEGCPEGRYIVIEHQTPEYLWQAALMRHANGALALEAVMACSEDLPSLAGRLAALTGAQPASTPHGGLSICPPGGGRIELQSTQALEARYGWRPAASPCFAGVEVRFADRTLAARLMEDNGVPVHRLGDEWFVAAGDANGFILRLTQ
jgi:hypothetical protein